MSSIEQHLSNLELTLSELNEASLKKSYRRLAMKYHPDRTKGDDTWFKRIKASYEWLDANLEVVLNPPPKTEPSSGQVYWSSFSDKPNPMKQQRSSAQQSYGPKKPYVYPQNIPKWNGMSSLDSDWEVARFEKKSDDFIGSEFSGDYVKKKKPTQTKDNDR
jgi:hypothetical protein